MREDRSVTLTISTAAAEEMTAEETDADAREAMTSLVGSIDMYDKYTFVEVPKEQADIVMDAMNHVKIKGKSVHVEKANRR